MNVYMTALFTILRRWAPGVYFPFTKSELKHMSVGGFTFIVDQYEVSFDWDASAITEVEPGVFKYESGYGPFENCHQISESCEEAIRKQGLRMDQVTALFLACARKITEFHVSIDDLQTEDISFGMITDNANEDAEYRVFLNHVAFEGDLIPLSVEPYMVEPAVLDDFNKGGKKQNGQ